MKRETYLSDKAIGLIIHDMLTTHMQPGPFEAISRSTLLEEALRRNLPLSDDKLDDWIAKGLFSRASERHHDGRAEMERLLRLLEIHHHTPLHTSLSDLYSIPVWSWLHLGQTVGITDLPQTKRALCSWIDSVPKASWEEVLQAMRTFAKSLCGPLSQGAPRLAKMLTVLVNPKAVILLEELLKEGNDPTDWKLLSHAFQQVIQRYSKTTNAQLAPVMDTLSQHLVKLIQYVFHQALTELPDSPDSLWYSARRLNVILTHNDSVTRAHFKRAPLSLADQVDSACADLLNCLLLMRDVSPLPTPVHHVLQHTLLPESQALRTVMTFTLPSDSEQELLSFDLPLFPPSAQSPSS